MISKTLLKLIDEAIVPAVLLLCVRFLSIGLLAYFRNIPFTIAKNGFVFQDKQDLFYLNTYSTLAMICVLTIGILYILLKSFLFHDSHISPGLTAKLFHFRLAVFIQNSYELYSQAAIWLAYSYLLTIVSIFLAASNLIAWWVAISGVLLCTISTVFLIIDVEEEMEIKKQKDNYIEEETLTNYYIDTN